MSERMLKTMAGGLAAAVVVAAVALVWIVRDQQEDRRPVEGNTAEAIGAVTASTALKDEALDVAADATTKVFSYSYTSLQADKVAAQDLLTGEMLEQYDRTMAGVASISRVDKATVSASVVGTALISVRARHAKVLIFVNRRTTGSNLSQPSLDLDRVVMTLECISGEWKVSELDAL